MSTPTERVQALLGGLSSDIDRYQQLAQLLDLQRSALGVCDSARCEEVGNQLLALYALLSASARQRSETLQSFRLDSNNVGLQRLFSRLPASHKAQAEQHWLTLQQHAIHCQQLNQRNGLLLTGQHQMFSALLNSQPDNFIYAR